MPVWRFSRSAPKIRMTPLEPAYVPEPALSLVEAPMQDFVYSRRMVRTVDRACCHPRRLWLHARTQVGALQP
jgi:hypothetical protein